MRSTFKARKDGRRVFNGWFISIWLVAAWGASVVSTVAAGMYLWEEITFTELPWNALLAGLGLLLFTVFFVLPFQACTLTSLGLLPDVSSDAGSSPTFLGRFRWLSANQCLRLALLLGLSFVTITALFYAEEDLRGRRAWNRYIREKAALGEPLFLSAMIGPARVVADEQNLALCPLLKPILQMRIQTNYLPSGVAGAPTLSHTWIDTNGMERLSRLSVTGGPKVEGQLPKEVRTLLSKIQSQPDSAQFVLTNWQSFYRLVPGLSPSLPGTTAAADVLAALQPLAADIEELHRAAANRPLAHWPIICDTNMPFLTLLPHLSHVLKVAGVLGLRATARLDERETQAALDDVQLGLRLAETIREEPFMICQLVRVRCVRIALAAVRHGLERRQFSDAELAVLQGNLLGIDLLEAYQRGVRGERATHSQWSIATKGPAPSDLRSLGMDWGRFGIVHFCLRAVPSGWVELNQLQLCRFYDRYLLAAADPVSHRVFPGTISQGREALATVQLPFGFLTRQFCGRDRQTEQQQKFDLETVRTFAYAQTELDQTLVACALERYRLAHSEYPVSLDQLGSRTLPKPPNDLFSGQSLQYRHTDHDEYLLYSVGWDEKDNGGRNPPTEKHELDSARPDWVWNLHR